MRSSLEWAPRRAVSGQGAGGSFGQVAVDGCSSGDVRESYELTLTEVLYTPLALTSRERQVVGTGYLYLALDQVACGVVPWVMLHWSWYATLVVPV